MPSIIAAGVAIALVALCAGQSCTPTLLVTEEVDEEVLGYQPSLPPDDSSGGNDSSTAPEEPAPSPGGIEGGEDPPTDLPNPSEPIPTAPVAPTFGAVQLQASASDGRVPLAVQFTVSSTSSGTSLPADAVYEWSIEGIISTGDEPRIDHTFTSPGTWPVRCCVTAASWPPDDEFCDEVMIVARVASGNGPNLAPAAFRQEVLTERNTPIEITLKGADPNSDALSFTLVEWPTHGALVDLTRSGAEQATVSYVPEMDFWGIDTFSFTVSDGKVVSAPAQVSLVVLNSTWAAPPASRTPQWPLKTRSVIYPEDLVQQVRALCDSDPAAAKVRSGWLAVSAYWISKTDEHLRDLIPDCRVPRAFDVAVSGCPIHGQSIYQHGTYPWGLDPENPFVVICPVGGERYPDNDFREYYRTGMRDPRYLIGSYADDGRGWVSPTGEKYWFVGYACHWNWYSQWKTALRALSRAYILSGDPVYARKAIVMLDRMAEVYPAMDHDSQSRMGEMLAGPYPGKVLNRIWETDLVRSLVVCYDLVHGALVGPDALSLPWRSAEQIRGNIEANLLEEAIDAIGRDQIRGNFGMAQNTLAYTVAVRQNGPVDELIGGIFDATGGNHVKEGLNYAWYNLVFKDGIPYETSPSYNFGWVRDIAGMDAPLRLVGYDLFSSPKQRLMFDAPLRINCAIDFTPNLGDARSISSGWIGPAASTYKQAYEYYGEPKYAWALNQTDGISDGLSSFDDLFDPLDSQRARADAASYAPAQSSRFLDGYGLAILNNSADSMAVSMYYGIRGYHGHKDALNIELFGHGRRLSPDLGYPDFMNSFVSGIQSWSKNTISHNCVMVDAGRQTGNRGGVLLRFHDSPTVHVADVESIKPYDLTDQYRRTLVLVDVGPEDGYLVDVFRVRGGSNHVLSIHGQEGEFRLAGAALPPPVTQGTLAGADVPYGQLYDDPVLGNPGYTGIYDQYTGSGYQHLFNWQSAIPSGTVTGTWTALQEPPGQLRVHVLAQAGQEIVVADAYVSPLQKIPTILKYMLVRRQAEPAGSTFACVWEMSGSQPIIDCIEMHPVSGSGIGSEQVVALTIRRGSAVDTVMVAPTAGQAYSFSRSSSPAATFNADVAVLVSTEENSKTKGSFACGGTSAKSSRAGYKVTVPATVRGSIVAADYGQATVVVNTSVSGATAQMLTDRTVRIFNSNHSCAYKIASAEAVPGLLILKLTGSDVFTGRIQVRSIDPGSGTVYTSTNILYPSNLAGMTLVTDDFSQAAPIARMRYDGIQLKTGYAPNAFGVGLGGLVPVNAWISDFGVGDEVEIELSVYSAG